MGHPHVYCSVVFGMWMLASYVFKPITFVYNKKAAVDFVFVSLLYKGSVGVIYRVF